MTTEVETKTGYICTTMKMLVRANKYAEAEKIREIWEKNLREGKIKEFPNTLGKSWNWKLTKTEREERLKIEPHFKMKEDAPRVKKLISWLKDIGKMTQSHHWQWRISQAMEENKEWYPFFITLTVDPSRADAREIMEGGKEWQAYKLRISETIRQKLGVLQSNRGGPKIGEYFQYAAIIEHGKSREHHHIHSIMWMKDIPESWKVDPNKWRDIPNATDVLELKTYWPWASVTKAEPFRTVGDVWSTRHGWKWPVKKGRPLPKRSAATAGAYLVKYLGKDSKEWHHRMKATRQLGLRMLTQYLKIRNPQDLMVLATKPLTANMQNSWKKTSVPNSLMRSHARRQLITRMWATSARRRQLAPMLFQPEKPSSWRKMLQSVEDGANPWSMDFEQRFAWQKAVLPPMVTHALSAPIDC